MGSGTSSSCGRSHSKVGTPGAKAIGKPADYVAAEFKRVGLTPGGVNGYIQPVKFRSRRIVEDKSSLGICPRTETKSRWCSATKRRSICGFDPAPTVDAPLVFAGYGLTGS